MPFTVPGTLKEIGLGAKSQVTSMRAAIKILRNNPPQSINPQQPSTDVTNAISAICAITHFLHYAKPVHIWSEAMSLLEKNWLSTIWPWISTLVKHFILDFEPTTQQGLDLREKLLWAVPSFTSFGDDCPAGADWIEHWIKHVVRTTPDAFPLIIKLWMHGIVLQSHPALSLHTMALKPFFLETFRDHRERFNQIIAAIPNSRAILLAYVVRRAPGKYTGQSIFCLVFALEAITICCLDQPLLLSFIAEDGIGKLTNLLYRLSSQPHLERLPDLEYDLKLLILCIKWILVFLSDAFRLCGNQAVISALKGRLLFSLVNSSPLLGYEMQHPSDPFINATSSLSRLYGDMLDGVLTFLVYRRVLNLFLQSSKKLILQDNSYAVFLESMGTHNREGSPGLLWQKIIAQSTTVRGQWEEYKNEGNFCCSNTECAGSDNEGLPKQCTRCTIAFYCSRSCQKQDWKHNHREICSETAELMKTSNLPAEVCDLEEDFFDWMILRKIQESLSVVKGHLEKFLTGEDRYLDDGSPVVAVISFEVIPSRLMVVRLDAYRGMSQRSPKKIPFDEDDLEELIDTASEEHLIVAYAIFPAGISKRKTYVRGIDSDELEHDSEDDLD
ncbi:hypothetical protein VKT23_019805 [Stygiomarasmius scandens]|uniref:MYND-type domain-containing protein n=1 Tax=Marasmiellus scandens TaxID=2682957 RepID=A0ABR1IKB4_9AGAR